LLLALPFALPFELMLHDSLQYHNLSS
jgi:hypothetical protein